ncbi:MAG: NADH:ubiquinone reductase (Na(+)-transporting) subunit F [Bacteroidales bacterium]|nr:NADH:ubiquinone reductase (Na(+)-transporting) subunit F [Bacteroidales bacterium]
MNYVTVFIAVVVFVLVIWLLVSVLLYARRRLVPDGTVQLTVNGERVLEHERGCSLLQALGDDHIFMPSACGGGGTCGCCKGRVLSGGGHILPTETSLIDRKMQEDHYRLFCQVKLKENMQIEIPSEVFGVKKWECTVESNRNVATYIKELIVKLPENERLEFKSGGYIQVDVPVCTVRYAQMDINEAYLPEWQKHGFLDLVMKNRAPATRAYSMANYPAENDRVMLNVRVATPPFDRKKGELMKVNPGVCSSYIYSLKEGDKIHLSGPYGDFFVKDTANEMMFIGGGAGMAPMRSHIFDQFKTKHTQRKTTFWYGGRSKQELFYIEDFDHIAKENPNFSWYMALSEPKPEDHWTGYVGFIHQVIYDQYLKTHETPEDIEYYICGPPLMLNAVLTMLDNLGVPESMIHYDDFGS